MTEDDYLAMTNSKRTDKSSSAEEFLLLINRNEADENTSVLSNI
jgi:hypothetical protein